MSAQPGCNFVLVWDFDFSLIDVNSDIWVPQKCGNEDLLNFIRNSRFDVQWTALMREVAHKLYAAGVEQSEIVAALQQMTVFPDVLAVIQELHAAGDVKQYIVSDANTVYIEEFLKAHGMLDMFVDIRTNPSHFDDKGCLHVARYHSPTAEPHGCPRCPVNMCKGSILRQLSLSHTARSVPALYVGDGGGDACPCLTELGPRDTIAARAAYPLADALAKVEGTANAAKARIAHWTNGAELAAIIRQQYLASRQRHS